MSSTNLDAPSPKLTIATIAIVVGLHALTAVALASVKTPEMKVEPKKVIPPIEIELITPPPPPPPVEIEEVKVEEKPKPVREVKPKPKAKPVAAPKPKVVQKKQPIEKPKPTKLTPPPVKKIQETVTPPPNDEANILAARQREQAQREQAQREQAQREQAQREQAQREQAQREQAQREQAQREQAQREQAQREQAQREQAQREQAQREQAQREQAQREQAAAEASNTPQNFSASDAHMTNTPKFSIPDSVLRVARKGDTFNVLLKVTVDKQGRVSSVVVARKSGNIIVDKEAARQMKSARFKPFTKNGVPVVGIVTLPVAYAVE